MSAIGQPANTQRDSKNGTFVTYGEPDYDEPLDRSPVQVKVPLTMKEAIAKIPQADRAKFLRETIRKGLQEKGLL